MSKYPMTVKGYERMKAELDRLKSEERLSIAKEIEEARAWGDLSENAEYKAAKEKQALIESQIMEKEMKIKDADIIKPSTLYGETVKFGATVVLIDSEDKKVVYSIVGEDEADISSGLLSYASPIGRALIGRRSGEYVEVKVPKGETVYKVEEVSYV